MVEDNVEGVVEMVNDIDINWTDVSPLDSNIENNVFDIHNLLPDDLYDDIAIVRGQYNGSVKSKPEVTGLILDESPTCIPHKDDLIQLEFSPDNLMYIINFLKSYSVNIRQNEPNLNSIDLYEKQNQCHELIVSLDEYVNKYVRNRPWHPLLKKWISNIGKDAIRKEIDNWSV